MLPGSEDPLSQKTMALQQPMTIANKIAPNSLLREKGNTKNIEIPAARTNCQLITDHLLLYKTASYIIFFFFLLLTSGEDVVKKQYQTRGFV